MFENAIQALKTLFDHENRNELKAADLSLLVAWIEQITSFAVTDKRKAQIQLLLSLLHEKNRDFDKSMQHAKNATVVSGNAENWCRYCQVLLSRHYQIDLTENEGQHPSDSERQLLQKAVQELANANNFTFAHVVIFFWFIGGQAGKLHASEVMKLYDVLFFSKRL